MRISIVLIKVVLLIIFVGFISIAYKDYQEFINKRSIKAKGVVSGSFTSERLQDRKCGLLSGHGEAIWSLSLQNTQYICHGSKDLIFTTTYDSNGKITHQRKIK